MPTYEYECAQGHSFEVFQRMTDEPAAECPECGAAAERKISGGAGFLFKGEGFYITDYRSDDYKKKASEESKAAAGKSSDSKSSDSKSSDSKSSGSKSSESKGTGSKSGDKASGGTAAKPSGGD